MVDPDRRPTAQEIEELIDLVRRDPASPAFIDLGEAYLSLGRPRDAIQVGNLGLEASPDNLEGRVMLARAYHALHQWKEAQGELLRVVKVDRSNRQGFALLGEVLLRRTDFERAVPVLQHAQNLDPTSPQILAMLRRARAGQALDPPPPVPQPIPPRGETDNRLEIQRSRGQTAQARPRPQVPPPQSAMPMVPAVSPQMPTMAIEPPPPSYDPGPAAFADASAGFGNPMPPLAAPRGAKQTAPPPMSVEGIRPRIVSGAKPQNAAAASLRQSAAVGETYLNDLLTGGLLDVAGVRVPDADFDLRPDRRWGRSTRRAFIFLFVVMVLGIGGGGTWYWWTEKQQAEAVARLQKESRTAIGQGDFTGLEDSLKKLSDALQKEDDNLLTFAYVVETAGLEALLYGTDTERVDQAYKAVGKDIGPGDPGARALVIGKAALELSRLHTLELRNAVTTLSEVNKLLDDYLAKHQDDRWARWLKGRAFLAAGERKAARAAFKSAGDGEAGLAVAQSDYADLLVDDGKLDDALAQYKLANAKAKDHPLVVVGRALARAEASFELDDAISELNDKFILDKIPPRTAAYRSLSLALANMNILPEDFPGALESLVKATANKPPGDPRFWARVAWAYFTLGKLTDASKARLKCIWYTSKKPELDPTVQLVDAGLALASGLPEQALALAMKIEGVRPRIIRAYALLDLGKPKDALGEAEEIIKIAPANVEAQILREHARLISSAKERGEAAEELGRLSKKSNSKLALHALGVAYLAVGKRDAAKAELEKALEVSETAPNPLAYRTRTALAEIALAAGDIEGAGKYLDESLKANSGYFPTLALQAKVVLRNKDPDRALTLLEPILSESAAITVDVQLTRAEALITKKGSTQKDKDQAKELIIALKDKGAPLPELSRIAALIDEDLPEELELPALEDAEEETPAPRPSRRGRRRGR